MDDTEIGRTWADHFPKWQHDKESDQICRLICLLMPMKAKSVIDAEARTSEERLQRVLNSCGTPRAQFDEVCGADRV